MATFIAWADADATGDRELADFYMDRFRPEFRRRSTPGRPPIRSTNPDAPPTPFAMHEYQLASQQQADELDARAEASAAEVRADIQRASNYVLTVVLYAVVLFFAGMSTRVRRLGCDGS